MKTFLGNSDYPIYDSLCTAPSNDGYKALLNQDFGPPIELMTEEQILAELAYGKEDYQRKVKYLESKLKEFNAKLHK